MSKPRSPFNRRPAALRIEASSDEAEVLLYDEIGYWGIQARDFVPQLKAIDAPTIHLRINSPGGDVFDGIAMYNALRDHPAKIVTHVDGLAASMASVIALAGDEVHMAENAFFMIHHPWGLTIGNAAEHRKMADTLEKIGGSLVGTYVARSTAEKDQVLSWMDDETWFTAEEAKDAGFADAIEEQKKVDASFDLSIYRNAPAALAGRSATPTKRDLERTLRDAGYSRSEAKAIAAAASAPSLRDAAEDGPLTAARQLAARILSL